VSPYRAVLDFDFEKCCSVSLAPTNVYACLVCGRYFQGRGPNTQAYTHSLEATHHVFMNLDSAKAGALRSHFGILSLGSPKRSSCVPMCPYKLAVSSSLDWPLLL